MEESCFRFLISCVWNIWLVLGIPRLANECANSPNFRCRNAFINFPAQCTTVQCLFSIACIACGSVQWSLHNVAHFWQSAVNLWRPALQTEKEEWRIYIEPTSLICRYDAQIWPWPWFIFGPPTHIYSAGMNGCIKVSEKEPVLMLICEFIN